MPVVGCGAASEQQTAAQQGVVKSASGAGNELVDPAAYLAEVKKVVKAGEDGFLSSPYPDGQYLLPSDLQLIKSGGWTGPTSAPPVKQGAKVIAISCLKGSGCDILAEGLTQAGDALGWDVETISSDGTPASHVSAFNAALAKKPDAIVGMSISPSIVGYQLAKAHKAGIKTLEMSAPQGPPPPDGYDFYMASLSTVSTTLELWAAMADANGKANFSFLWDSSNPQFAIALPILQRVIQQCGTCKELETLSHPVATAGDAVAMGQLTASLIQQSGPDLGYIVTPYDTGAPGIIAAVKQSANPDVKVMSANGEVQQVAAVAAGDQFTTIGKSLLQQGWAGADAVVRLLGGEEPLPLHKEGMGLHIFKKANAPADGKYDWVTEFGYEDHYKQAWGVG
jgi:ribose transport system substrate-binding protein